MRRLVFAVGAGALGHIGFEGSGGVLMEGMEAVGAEVAEVAKGAAQADVPGLFGIDVAPHMDVANAGYFLGQGLDGVFELAVNAVGGGSVDSLFEAEHDDVVYHRPGGWSFDCGVVFFLCVVRMGPAVLLFIKTIWRCLFFLISSFCIFADATTKI